MTNASFIDYLKSRIEEAQLELTDANQKKLAAEQQVAVLLKDIEGYQHTLAAEERRSGTSLTAQLEVQPTPVPPQSNNGHASNATQSILSYVRVAGARGITRIEIKNSLERDGISVHPNYPYVVVSKLKENKKIKEDRGRLYIAE